MLSDEVIEKVVQRLVRRIEQGNEYILKKIGKNIRELGTLTPSRAHELVQIMKYGGDYEKIVKKIAEITKLNKKDIYKIFREVAKNDYEFAEQFYKYRNKKYIPWEENVALRKQVDALAKITADKYVNLSRSKMLGLGIRNKKGKIVFKPLKRAYNELLDQAVLNVGQGKETFDSAMYRVLKDISASGLKIIYEYKAKDKLGNEITKKRLMRLDSVLSMQMQGALRDLHTEEQLAFGEEFGADGVLISAHENPAPDHEYLQGREFRKEEFEKLQNDEKAVSVDGMEFPAIAKETGYDRRSIGQYNCKHYIFSIVIGVNKPQYTNEELQKIINNNHKKFKFDKKEYTRYEGQQLQRQLELEIRKAKESQIFGRETNNEKLIYKSQEKITELMNKYDKLNKASGLQGQIERMRVSGYRKVAKKKEA